MDELYCSSAVNASISPSSTLTKVPRHWSSSPDSRDIHEYRLETQEQFDRVANTTGRNQSLVCLCEGCHPEYQLPPTPMQPSPAQEDTFEPIREQARDTESRLARLEAKFEGHLKAMRKEVADMKKYLEARVPLADAYDTAAHTPESSRSPDDRHNGAWVLVENLPEGTEAVAVLALFEVCGPILHLQLHAPSRSKGPYLRTRYAYIHFADPQAATVARTYHGFYLEPKTIMVFLLNNSENSGLPDQIYDGSALEILDFSKPTLSNARSPVAVPAPLNPKAKAPKARLTLKTDLIPTRRIDTPEAYVPVRPKLTLKTNLVPSRRIDTPKDFVPVRPKLKLETNCGGRKVVVPQVDPVTVEAVKAVVTVRPRLTIETRIDLTPSPGYMESSGESKPKESSPFEIIQSGLPGNETTTALSEDDELVVFQGVRRRYLRTPPPVKVSHEEIKKVRVMARRSFIGRVMRKVFSLFKWGKAKRE